MWITLIPGGSSSGRCTTLAGQDLETEGLREAPAVRVVVDVELDLADAEQLELLDERAVRVLETDRLRVRRQIRVDQLGHGLDVVAVVAARAPAPRSVARRAPPPAHRRSRARHRAPAAPAFRPSVASPLLRGSRLASPDPVRPSPPARARRGRPAPGRWSEELARARVHVAIHPVERAEHREIGAARPVGEEERARSRGAGAGRRGAARTRVRGRRRVVSKISARQPAVVADQTEARHRSAGTRSGSAVGRQLLHPPADPAQDVEVEGLVDPDLEPALLARDARIRRERGAARGSARRGSRGCAAESWTRAALDLGTGTRTAAGLGAPAPVVLRARGLDDREGELLQARARAHLHRVGGEALAVEDDLGGAHATRRASTMGANRALSWG